MKTLKKKNEWRKTLVIRFKNTELVYRLECQFVKNLNIKCRNFQLILQMISVVINLTITLTYLHLETSTTESIKNIIFEYYKTLLI